MGGTKIICGSILVLFAFAVGTLLFVATTHNQSAKRPNVLETMSRIRPGMTYAEICEIIPPDEHDKLLAWENGGVFYDFPFDSKYLIQLRFEHTTGNQSARDARINYSPRLRDRTTLAFIAGDEIPWPVGQ